MSDNTVVVTGELQEGDTVELFINTTSSTTSSNLPGGQGGEFPGGGILTRWELSCEANMIETENLSKIYRLGETKVHALRKVSIKIADGEMVAIMGPSGSGKSTLLAILGCLDSPTRGIYHLDGQAVENLNEKELAAIRRKKIGFVFPTI